MKNMLTTKQNGSMSILYNKTRLIAALLIILSFILYYKCADEPVLAVSPKVVPIVIECEEVDTVPVIPSEKREGIVSYYGDKWNGRTTANMEIYNSDLLTCASPSLPFNTMIEITNLHNNKSVIVRVNDRGPFKMDAEGKAIFPLIPHPKRIFDLSKGSFQKIGSLDKGLLTIKYEILK